MMKCETMWIDEIAAQGLSVGHCDFLVRQGHNEKADVYWLQDRPPKTNQSHEYRIFGWCGSYNGTSTYGMGLWQVTKILANGRMKIRKLEPWEAAPVCEAKGFPDLVKQFQQEARQ